MAPVSFHVTTLAAPDPGGRRYVEMLRAASLSAGVYRLEAGADDRQQPHDEDEIYLVLEGAGAIVAGEERAPVGPGSVIFVAARVPHRFVEITSALSLLVVFAPAEGPRFDLVPVGFVRSSLTRREDAPMQGHEGAPDAWLEIDARAAGALHGISAGDEIWVVTWLHRADRAVLQTHPRDDRTQPLLGVFATRSPDRPNPLGLHRVEVREIRGAALRVGPLEAIDGTPVVDVKPVLGGDGD